MAATTLTAARVGAQCAPETLLRTIPNPAPAMGDYFGGSVAVSGNFAVVGASRDDAGAVNAGSAYVFDVTTGALVATLSNPAPAVGDRFGSSVAISGNVAVVGAPKDDAGASGAGTAYVFNVATGDLISTLNNPAPAVDDQFGVSVAISENLAVIGAYADDVGGLHDAGTAYVFNVTTGALISTLNKPVPMADDWFGVSVAISGNVVVVGANLDDAGASNAGAAYVFNATTGALTATLSNPSPVANDQFGVPVAVSGNTAVVGGQLADAGATDSGTAYVFNATTGALTATLSNPTPATNDHFGTSVAISGNECVVGAWQDDAGATDAGTTYVFNATTGALAATLSNPAPAADDRFGRSVAISGNVVVVGAYGDDAGATDAGSAYIFSSSCASPTPTASPTPWLTPTESASPTLSQTPSISPTKTASPTPSETPTPSRADVLDYLLGRTDDAAGLDFNHDGVVDVGDVLASAIPIT